MSAVDQDKKRELRQLKRDIKRAGVKHRRRQLKRGLADDPDEAHRGRASTYGQVPIGKLNGLDRLAAGVQVGMGDGRWAMNRSIIAHSPSPMLHFTGIGSISVFFARKAASTSRSVASVANPSITATSCPRRSTA